MRAAWEAAGSKALPEAQPPEGLRQELGGPRELPGGTVSCAHPGKAVLVRWCSGHGGTSPVSTDATRRGGSIRQAVPGPPGEWPCGSRQTVSGRGCAAAGGRATPGRPRAVARRCWWDPAGLSLLPEMTGEIRRCLTEVESCFRLLVPLDLGLSPGAALPAVAPAVAEEGPPDLGDEERPCCSRSLPACARCPAAVGAGVLPSEDEDSDQEEFVRRHGLGSRQYTLDVELSSGTLSPSCGQALPCRASWPWASGRLLSLGFLGPRRGWGPKAAASVATGPAVTGSMVRGRA